MDEIEIKFKGKKIDENLIIFKGTIFNTGNIDIDKSIVHQPFSIKLPKNYFWIQSNIIDKSEGLVVVDRVENDKLIFNWDLLKENEYFTFDSLVEYKQDGEEDKNKITDISKRLSSELKLEQRISNLKCIEKKKLPSKPFSIAGQIFLSIYILSFVIAGLYFSVGQFTFPEYEVVYQTSINGKIQTMTYEPSSISEVEISASNDSPKQKLSLTNFQNNLKNNSTLSIQKKSLSYWGLGLGGFFAILMSIVLFSINREFIKERNLYLRMKIIADKYNDLPNDEEDTRRRKLFSPFL